MSAKVFPYIKKEHRKHFLKNEKSNMTKYQEK
jgi:hypothetical protein